MSTLGMRCWSTSLAKPLWATYCSRVVDKHAEYSISILDMFLTLLQNAGHLRTIKTIAIWSDCGTHFRARVVVGTCGAILSERFRKSFVCNFGLEKHFKNPVDSHFGLLTRWRNQHASRKMIATVAELLEGYRLGAEAGGNASTHWFIDYLPEPLIKLQTCVFKDKSLPCTLTASFSWHFRINDDRRTRFRGSGVRYNIVTAIDCRAVRVPGMPMSTSILCLPEIETFVAGTEHDPDAEEQPVKLNAEVISTCKDYFGWKMSYRQSEPEDTPASAYAPRLRRRRDTMATVRDRIEVCGRRPGHDERLSAARRNADKRLKTTV